MSPAASEPEAATQRGLVIGLGNRWRRDDGLGLHAVEALRAALADYPVPLAVDIVTAGGEPAELMALWAGRSRVWLIDALVAGTAPGCHHRLDAGDPLPQTSSHSSHGLGLAQAVELARALDELPERLVIHGIEPADLADGSTLSTPVAQTLPRLITALLDEIGARDGVVAGPRNMKQ